MTAGEEPLHEELKVSLPWCGRRDERETRMREGGVGRWWDRRRERARVLRGRV